LIRIWEDWKTRQENVRSFTGVRAKNKRSDQYCVHWIVRFRASVLEEGLRGKGAAKRMKKGNCGKHCKEWRGSVPSVMEKRIKENSSTIMWREYK
jgi:hypothetical protein